MFLSDRMSIVAVLFVVLAMGVARVDAVLVSFNDPSFFGTDQVFVNFSGLAGSSGQVFSYDDLNFWLVNDTSGWGPTVAFAPQTTYAREFGPVNGHFLNSINPAALDNLLDIGIDFPDPIRQVAVEVRSNRIEPLDDIHFSFFSGGTMIDQVIVPSRGYMDFFFYGFASSQPFDRLVVGNRPDSRFGLDNIRYGYEGFVPTGEPGVVPEPISVGLVLVGMAALLPALGRRRRPCR